MTRGYLCDRCENFRDDVDQVSTFETTVEATGKRIGKGEHSEWDLCPNCATTLVNEFLEEDNDE